MMTHYQYILLGLLVLILIFWSFRMFNKSVTAQQVEQISMYSAQYLYPHTREQAIHLLKQSQPIRQSQYFKFLRTLNYEKNRIHFQKEENK